MVKVSVIAVMLLAMSFFDGSIAFTLAPQSLVRKPVSLDMTVLAYGSKKKDFKEGSPMSTAVKQLGVPVKYSCKK